MSVYCWNYADNVDAPLFQAMPTRGNSRTVYDARHVVNCDTRVGKWLKRWAPWCGLGAVLRQYYAPWLDIPVLPGTQERGYIELVAGIDVPHVYHWYSNFPSASKTLGNLIRLCFATCTWWHRLLGEGDYIWTSVEGSARKLFIHQLALCRYLRCSSLSSFEFFHSQLMFSALLSVFTVIFRADAYCHGVLFECSGSLTPAGVDVSYSNLQMSYLSSYVFSSFSTCRGTCWF